MRGREPTRYRWITSPGKTDGNGVEVAKHTCPQRAWL